EAQAALVPVEVRGGPRALAAAVGRRAVREEDVHLPVAVVVEDRNAVARGLEDVALLVLAARHVLRREPGLRGHVPEVGADRGQVRLDGGDAARGALRARHALVGLDGGRAAQHEARGDGGPAPLGLGHVVRRETAAPGRLVPGNAYRPAVFPLARTAATWS